MLISKIIDFSGRGSAHLGKALSKRGSQISWSMPLRIPKNLSKLGAIAGWPLICDNHSTVRRGPLKHDLHFISSYHLLGRACTGRHLICPAVPAFDDIKFASDGKYSMTGRHLSGIGWGDSG